MKRNSRILLAFAVLAAIVAQAPDARAQTSMPIRIKIDGEPASAVGIVLSSKGVKMKVFNDLVSVDTVKYVFSNLRTILEARDDARL